MPLFEGGFEIVDDFKLEMGPDTFMFLDRSILTDIREFCRLAVEYHTDGMLYHEPTLSKPPLLLYKDVD